MSARVVYCHRAGKRILVFLTVWRYVEEEIKMPVREMKALSEREEAGP